MYCQNCGTELADNATFCSNCGSRVKAKTKNIYIALILTFILSGLGSIYAGNVKKGLILLALRILFAALGVFLNIFFIFSMLVWAYAFYEAYKDVEIANGNGKPDIINDFQGWEQNKQIIAVLIVVIILIITVAGCVGVLTVDNHSYDNSNTHYYNANSGSSGSSHSSHYGGVDDSPSTIAKNDPDWYYDHYDYGDYDEIDEYLESQGYD